MRRSLLSTIAIAAFYTFPAQANWLPERTIEYIYMQPTSSAVYATLDAPIGYADCPAAVNISISDITINKRFDEIVSLLMRGHATQSQIEIRNNDGGTYCNNSGTVVKDPYIRFSK